MVVRNGRQFLEGLRDAREVWLEGERVADVTTHPKLSRLAHTLAALYDLQHDPNFHDEMTFKSPNTGQPVALSFIVPENQDDLLRRRRALEITAQASYGMLGRTPDYVNIQVPLPDRWPTSSAKTASGTPTTCWLITSICGTICPYDYTRAKDALRAFRERCRSESPVRESSAG